jgi:hypothetical protein
MYTIGDSRIGWNPRTHTRKNSRKSGWQRISESLYFSSNNENPFTRAPWPPFIGKREDFLHSDISSDQENIPNVNTYMNVISYPVICGTNFEHLQACHSFILQTRTFGTTPLTWLVRDFAFVQKILREFEHGLRKSELDSEVEFPESQSFFEAFRSLKQHSIIQELMSLWWLLFLRSLIGQKVSNSCFMQTLVHKSEISTFKHHEALHTV